MARQTKETEDIKALEATEPLLDAPRSKIHRVRPGPVRETYFTLRLAPQELDHLARAAVQRGTKPGTLARDLILAGLQQLQESSSLDERVAALEQEVRELRQRVAVK